MSCCKNVNVEVVADGMNGLRSQPVGDDPRNRLTGMTCLRCGRSGVATEIDEEAWLRRQGNWIRRLDRIDAVDKNLAGPTGPV